MREIRATGETDAAARAQRAAQSGLLALAQSGDGGAFRSWRCSDFLDRYARNTLVTELPGPVSGNAASTD